MINAASANHAPNENIAIGDYIGHVRAFGRFVHPFAGRSLDATDHRLRS